MSRHYVKYVKKHIFTNLMTDAYQYNQIHDQTTDKLYFPDLLDKMSCYHPMLFSLKN